MGSRAVRGREHQIGPEAGQKGVWGADGSGAERAGHGVGDRVVP